MIRRRLILCTFLGSLTTLLLAWGSVVLNPMPHNPRHDELDGRMRDAAAGENVGSIELWTRRAPGTTEYCAWALPRRAANDPDVPHTVTRESDYRFERRHSAWVRTHVLPWEIGAAPWPAVHVREMRFVSTRGWPWRCLWHEIEYSNVMDSPTGARPPPSLPPVMRGAIPFPRFMDQRKAINIANEPGGFPFWPYWPGLLADLLLWTLAWLGLLAAIPAAFRVVRARLRTRKGHCPHCNYDLQGLAAGTPCPECGHPRTPPPTTPSAPRQ